MNNIIVDLVVLPLPISHNKFVNDFYKDHKGEFMNSMLRMLMAIEVHIKMAKLEEADMKKENERSKANATKFKSNSLLMSQDALNPTHGVDNRGKIVCVM